MYIKTAFVLLSALASTAIIVGCGSGGTGGDGATTGTQRASLHRAKTCGDLLGDLKADAAYKLNHGINRQIEVIRACQAKYSDERCNSFGGYIGGGVGLGFGTPGAAEDAAAKGGAPTPSSPNASSSSSSGGTGAGNESASSYSETNTQVKGVDEADIVKNDGKYLYVLHGRAFKMLNAWPANELKEMGTLDIEGQPTEMFVAENKVVVYSSVNGASIFAAAGVPTKEIYSDFGYGYGYGGGVARGDIAIAPVAPGGGYVPPSGPYIPLTKMTVMKLEGTTPVVTREVYFEGGYLDARRVGPHVRTVLQGNAYGPKLKYSVNELYPQPYITTDKATGASTPNPEYREDQYPKTGSESIAALEKLRAENLGTINASVIGDWIPYTFVKDGAGVKAQRVACEDFYVPTAGSTESGITEVASLDLGDPAATPKESAILGRADTVYGNADTLYLATRAWVEPPFVWNDPGDVAMGGGAAGSTPASPPDAAPAPATPKPSGKAANAANGVNVNVGMGLRPQTNTATTSNGIVTWSSNNTHIHKFDFKTQPNFPNYVASGTVSGNIKDQFSLDDKDGFLRIATTENRQYVTTEGKYVPQETAPVGSTTPPARPNTVNHLFVLEQKGPWLDLAGDVGELAPNEQIYSVRFVDHRGYVVTFRQVDPLFVIDLATPSSPRVLAALKIPGFSEYMHPLDGNHLLTIGRDASNTGRAQGLQLKIFDVTDGANPRVQHEYTYTGDEYGSSEAQYDHKAFTYFADKGLLAFPYQSYGQTMRSSLELFKVDLASGFNKLGSIDHTPLVETHKQGYCGGYYTPAVRRGVFLENFVYSVSYGGVVVKDSTKLAEATAIAPLPLPSPLLNDGYGPACY
jgi:hypothetical protein